MKITKIRSSIIIMGTIVSFFVTPISANNIKGNSELLITDIQENNENQYFDINKDDELNIDWDEVNIIPDDKENNVPKSALNKIQTRISGQWIESSDGRWWYKHSDGSYTTNGWELIGGQWYYFDNEGWMVTGWINDAGERYYCDNSGAMVTEWKTINGSTYYFNSSGEMQKNWISIDDTYYYFGSNGKYVDDDGTRMISEALKYVGNPYVYGGNSLTNGTDCSGYVYLIHKMYGYDIERRASLQYSSSKKISSSSLKPGDLVFYCENGNDVDHVAFYVGTINGTDDCIVHAANSRKGIIVSTRTYWSVTKKYGTYWR